MTGASGTSEKRDLLAIRLKKSSTYFIYVSGFFRLHRGASHRFSEVPKHDLRAGFTLIEMLIVVALFSSAAVLLSQIFVSFQRLHRRVANAALVGEEMRYVTEFVVRAARNNQIDYANAPLKPQDSTLRLLTGDGGTLYIAQRPTADCNDTTIAHCLALSTDEGQTWESITGKRVNVDRFDVYVRPTSSPFLQVGGKYDNDVQPMVSVNIVLRYMAENSKEQASLTAQTTVSSRVYPR